MKCLFKANWNELYLGMEFSKETFILAIEFIANRNACFILIGYDDSGPRDDELYLGGEYCGHELAGLLIMSQKMKQLNMITNLS